MRYLKKFKSLADANTQGENGLDSPHIDIIEGIRGAVNYVKIQGNLRFNCSFDNSGKVENVSPILPKETWRFNSNIGYSRDYANIDFLISFTSNNQNFYALHVAGDNRFSLGLIYKSGIFITAYSNDDGWENQNYRIIILDEPATGDLLTFLQANATKIS